MKNKKKIKEFLIFLIVISAFFIFDELNKPKVDNINTDVKQTINTPSENNLKIYFLDVGQADCILIDNNHEYALIDAGNNEDGKKIVDYLSSLGVQSFKYVIGTHAHEDHIGGMDDIIKNFTIDHFYMPDVITTTKTFEDVLDALEEKQVAFETPEEDATFSLADSKFTVLHVGKDKDDLNDTSIVLRMTYQNTSYLFTGDATSKVEKNILDKNIASDVLKIGHHGSQYSSSAHFLKKVNPKYAIIEVGKNNTYNHPKDITLKKLEKLGTRVYRTDQEGTIIVTSDGNNISIKTETTDTNG